MRQPKRPKVLEQAEQLIRLAKAEGCTVLKVGEFFVQFGTAVEPHDAIRFDAAGTPLDEYYEARKKP